jgi:uncharacterized protein YbcI
MGATLSLSASRVERLVSAAGAESWDVMSTDEQDRQRSADEVRTSGLMELSNAMVRLYKDHFGRGPTRVRSHWCGDDVLTVTLDETLTPAERNLVRMGEHQRLRDVRMFFQYATVREFCEPVEHITGRKVRAFISGIDTAVDGLAVETFVLHPAGYSGPSRLEQAEL